MDIVYASICNEILFRGVACPPQTLDIPSKPDRERARFERACLDGVCKQQQNASEEGSEHFSDGNDGLITQGIYADTCGALVR